MTGSVCGYKVKANSLNQYLTVCSGPDPVRVAGNLKGEESGQGQLLYIPKLDSGKCPSSPISKSCTDYSDKSWIYLISILIFLSTYVMQKIYSALKDYILVTEYIAPALTDTTNYLEKPTI